MKCSGVATTPEIAEQFLLINANVDVMDLLPQVKVPTLVMHASRETRVPCALGQEIAAGIPGAKFVALDSRNHLILADEPAHRAMADAIADFLGEKRIRGPLPGTATLGQRLEGVVGGVQRNWLLKLVVIAGTLVSAGLAFLQLWRMMHH